MATMALTRVLTDPVVLTALDREQSLGKAVEKMQAAWDFDLYKRSPGSALKEDGVIGASNLDLATFMYALARRGAVINLPTYKTMRAATKREGEHVTSKENRHGKITGVYANKGVFSFGVRIVDQNVIKHDDESNEVGAFRNFSLVDVKGKWHEGWKTIDFFPSAKENDFLEDNEQWDGYKVEFNKFVMPQRWVSLFSRSYIATKLLIDRLSDEAKYYGAEAKRLKAAGVDFPAGYEPTVWGEQEVVGEQKSVKCPAFEVEIDYPSMVGVYTAAEETPDELLRITKLRNHYVYSLVPQLRFATRCVEYAYWKHGMDGEILSDVRIPKKISRIESEWESGYKLPRGRKVWHRIVLSPETATTPEVALRLREYPKTERVSADD